MRNRILIIPFVFSIILAGCATGQVKNQEASKEVSGPDLSTDEKVLAELQRLSGRTYDKKDVCIRRTGLNDLIMVGFFANDRGCMGSDAFFKGELIKPEEHISEILKHSGWEGSDEKKKALAKYWITDVYVGWESVTSHKPEGFPGNLWFEPRYELKDGGVAATCWIQKPSGMMPQAVYHAVQIYFDKNGNIVNEERMGSHIIYYNGEPDIDPDGIEKDE